MEILVIIVIVLLVAGVVLYRKMSGKRGDDTDLSTGNPSANKGDDQI